MGDKLKTALFIAALVSQACAPGGAFLVDSRFTASERLEIQRAADTWEAYGAHIDLVWDQHTNGTEARSIVRAAGDREAFAIDPELINHPNSPGLTKTAIGHETIVILPERVGQTNPLWYVVAHEFGHALGMAHIDDPRAIMHWTNTAVSARCVTQADLEEMCRTGECVRKATCD